MNESPRDRTTRSRSREQREHDLVAELDAHLELETLEGIERGLAPDAARTAAYRVLGSVPAIQDHVRDVWRTAVLAQAWQDARYALRTLRRSPLWTAAALIALGLGIGANTAIFSLADALLFRPLAIAEPDRVLSISTASADSASEGLSYPDFDDLRRRVDAVDGAVGYRLAIVGVATSPDSLPQMRMSMAVTGDFFQTLGVAPLLGRAFLPDESETPGRDAVAILSHDLWRSAFNADPQIVGRTARISQRVVTVVGVAPESFTGMHPVMRPALYVPLTLSLAAGRETDPMRDRGQRILTVKARLRDGATRKDLQGQLDALASALAASDPATNGRRTFVARSELQARTMETPELLGLVGLLGGLTLVVLAIACANVANLLLARGRTRTREVAIRLAIGCGHFRLARQMLTESAVLALCGGGLGLLVATVAIRFLRSISLPTDIPLVLNVRLDARALLVSLAAAVVSALAFGVLPAVRAAKTDVLPGLRRQDAGTRGRLLGTRTLVIGQIALSLVLLVATALMIDAFRKASTADPGMRTDQVLMIEMDPGTAGYSADSARLFFERLMDRIRAEPLVASATLARGIPFRPNFTDETVVVEGHQLPAGQAGDRLPTNVVDDRYFDTMQIPIVRGRAFASADRADALPTVVVNEAFATRYWPQQNPLGRRLRFHPDGQWLEVVGVARTGKYRFLGEAPQPYLYLPLAQNPRSRLTLLAATTGAPLGAADRLREIVRGLDPQVPLYNVRPLDRFYADGVLGTQRVLLQVVGAMGTVGLSLALVGLYAVVAYSASRRIREFAIRMAIGATRGTVMRLVLRDGITISGIGIAIGLMLSVPVGRLLGTAFVGLGPLSPWVFAIAPATVVALTIAACLTPAWRSSLVEPVAVLRLE